MLQHAYSPSSQEIRKYFLPVSVQQNKEVQPAAPGLAYFKSAHAEGTASLAMSEAKRDK